MGTLAAVPLTLLETNKLKEYRIHVLGMNLLPTKTETVNYLSTLLELSVAVKANEYPRS